MNLWINAAFYQATWLAAVIGAARGWWWAGPALLAVFASWQLATSAQRRADTELMLVAASAGFIVDSAFVRCGLLQYATTVPFATLAPVWILALWISFALTLNHALAYLKSHLFRAALLGAIGAPLAYLAAARGWGAIVFVASPSLALGALAVVWAIVSPALFWLAGRRTRIAVGTAPVAEIAS
ncbi:MAG: DUF2878 domain-containing protein [Proteobacteria bacterium]|nr:DUF2878 domain-containing protein [Pseudomonadota bacterium]